MHCRFFPTDLTGVQPDFLQRVVPTAKKFYRVGHQWPLFHTDMPRIQGNSPLPVCMDFVQQVLGRPDRFPMPEECAPSVESVVSPLGPQFLAACLCAGKSGTIIFTIALMFASDMIRENLESLSAELALAEFLQFDPNLGIIQASILERPLPSPEWLYRVHLFDQVRIMAFYGRDVQCLTLLFQSLYLPDHFPLDGC